MSFTTEKCNEFYGILDFNQKKAESKQILFYENKSLKILLTKLIICYISNNKIF